MSQYQVIGNYCLVESDPAPSEVSGIILPDASREQPKHGTVVAVGPGLYSDLGKRIPMDIHIGDKVWYGEYAGMPMEIDGKEYKCMRQTEIFVRVPPNNKPAS